MVIGNIVSFVVTLVAVGWATRWYLNRYQPREDLPTGRHAARTRDESPPLVTREAAEQLLQKSETPDDALTEAVEEIAAEPAVAAAADAPAEEQAVETGMGATAAPDSEAPAPPAAPPPAAVADDLSDAGEEADSGDMPSPDEGDVAEERDEIIGYCARCRTKRTMINTEETTTKRGRPAVRGKCEFCDAGMFVFVAEH